MIISADSIYTGAEQLTPGWIEVADSHVVDFGQGRTKVELAVDGVIIPGFVDVHCHGSGGYGFNTDPMSAAKFLHSQGTTSVLASLVTDEIRELNAQIERIRPLVESEVIAGIHLEGPCISPRRRGAHNQSLLRDPLVFDQLNLELVKMVTIAPELPNALQKIGRLVEQGIVVAVGHSDADGRVAKAAFDAGATMVTHLFNAMRGLNHREPGIVDAALLDSRVFVELITDGVHLTDETIALVNQAKPAGWFAVSDASAGGGMSEFHFTIAGLQAHVKDGAARLSNGTLAGSAVTMSQIFDRLVRQFGFELAVQVTSTRPARALGLRAGVLERGASADLVVWENGVQRVMREGQWISTSS